jgi:hypothetical protein
MTIMTITRKKDSRLALPALLSRDRPSSDCRWLAGGLAGFPRRSWQATVYAHVGGRVARQLRKCSVIKGDITKSTRGLEE